MHACNGHRNPQKKKSAIQDWHLVLFVAIIVIVDIAFLVLHILLEGIIAKFDVAKTPNKENPSIIEGVRCYIQND